MTAMVPDEMGPYVALLLAGFAVGVAGHLFEAPLAGRRRDPDDLPSTFLLPVAINIFEDDPNPPGPNIPTPY